MEKLNIVYVDDQREVLLTLSKDLHFFEKYCTVEECESADEAMQLIDEIDKAGGHVTVIISDHIMPGVSGVEFLTQINRDQRFRNTRKMLLTGLATHQDTIEAINQASIDKYIEKPWKSDDLVKAVKVLLTHYIFSKGLDYEGLTPVLDQLTLLDYLQQRVD